jgi:sec-independent protein translocase protein TatA
MQPILAFLEGALSPFHILVVLIVGLLLFGKRLPEVGRSLGKGILEFKKGLKGLEDEFEEHSSSVRKDQASIEAPRPPERIAPTAPRFEDQPASPQQPQA